MGFTWESENGDGTWDLLGNHTRILYGFQLEFNSNFENRKWNILKRYE